MTERRTLQFFGSEADLNIVRDYVRTLRPIRIEKVQAMDDAGHFTFLARVTVDQRDTIKTGVRHLREHGMTAFVQVNVANVR